MSGSKRWVNRPEGSTWGDFGPHDQRGRINLLTPAKLKQGIAEVKEFLPQPSARFARWQLVESTPVSARYSSNTAW